MITVVLIIFQSKIKRWSVLFLIRETVMTIGCYDPPRFFIQTPTCMLFRFLVDARFIHLRKDKYWFSLYLCQQAPSEKLTAFGGA